jgi:hypothetical protein
LEVTAVCDGSDIENEDEETPFNDDEATRLRGGSSTSSLSSISSSASAPYYSQGGTPAASEPAFSPYPNQPALVVWNNGLFHVIDGSWFYLRRWLGAQHMVQHFSRLSSRQAMALLRGLALSDGEMKQLASNHWKISTCSIPMRDHIMMLGVIAGGAVNVYRTSLADATVGGVSTRSKGNSDNWKVCIQWEMAKEFGVCATNNFTNEELSKEEYKQYSEAEEEYRRNVYCLTVRDNPTFYVRRLCNARDTGTASKDSVGMGGCFTGNCSLTNEPRFIGHASEWLEHAQATRNNHQAEAPL